MDLDKAREIFERIDPVVAARNAAAVMVGVVVAMVLARLVRRPRIGSLAKKIKPSRADRAFTFLAAIMASALAANTMWLVIGDQMPDWLKVGTVAFLDVALIGTALRSRYFRLLHAENVEKLLKDDPTAAIPPHDRDIDGIAVWVIAIGSSILGWAESRTTAEALFRMAAPLVAAFSWDRGLLGEIRQYATRKASTIRWNNPVEAMLVRLGLVSPSEQHRTAATADRSRRMGLVIDAGYRMGVASRMPFKLNLLVDAYTHGRYYRRLRAVQRRYGYGPELLTEIRLGVAALRQAGTALADEQLAHLDPWGDPAADRRAAEQATAELEQTRADAAAAEAQRTAELAALAGQLEQMRVDAREAVEAANALTVEARTALASAEARVEAGSGRDELVSTMLEQARLDADRYRSEMARLQAALDQARAATTRVPAGPAPRTPQFAAPNPTPRATETVTPVTIAGLPEFDPSTPCGCLRNGKDIPCGWTLAEHIARKAEQVRMVLSYLDNHFPKYQWVTRPERTPGKSHVELACRIDPDDPETSLAKSSNVQNQVAWIFDQLRTFALEQTAPV